jgi:hypothetical protein
MDFIVIKKESVFSTSVAWQIAWREGILNPLDLIYLQILNLQTQTWLSGDFYRAPDASESTIREPAEQGESLPGETFRADGT